MRWVKDEVGGGGNPVGKCVVRVVGGGGMGEGDGGVES